MPQFLIVDMHTLWLISGVVTLAAAGVVAFLRSLHHSTANALGLHALALAIGGTGLLMAAAAARRPDSLLAASADATIASSLLLACESVRRLYGANPRPALLMALLFATSPAAWVSRSCAKSPSRASRSPRCWWPWPLRSPPRAS